MRYSKLLGIVLLALMIGGTQLKAQGIKFEKGSFEEVMAKAKAEDKLIFVDFFTVWCGPCKMMDRDVFPLSEVGDYYNSKYISYKVDAEKEGRDLANRYNVTVYPTYMFLKADGTEFSKSTSSMSAEKFLELGAKAFESASDPNNLSVLKSQYDINKEDPIFLRTYIDKMIDNKEAPIDALNSYLKYQKDIDEESSRMMEFLIKYSDYLVLGGEADRILKSNFTNYLDIAAPMEASKVNNIVSKMLKFTRRIALRDLNAEMYSTFLSSWEEYLPEVRGKIGVPYHLELLQLQNDSEGYRTMAINYLDSLVNSKTVESIREQDAEHYRKYNEANPLVDNFMIKSYHEMNKDKEAKVYINNITSIGDGLLKYSVKEDLPMYKRWIEFSKDLIPDNTSLLNFESNVIYSLDDKQKGIDAKQLLLDKVGTSRQAAPIREDLKKMKEGNF